MILAVIVYGMNMGPIKGTTRLVLTGLTMLSLIYMIISLVGLSSFVETEGWKGYPFMNMYTLESFSLLSFGILDQMFYY